MSAETLETERLRLRRPTAADAPRLAQLANDPDVARMTTRIPHPYRLQDAEGFLAFCETGHETVFALDHKDHGLVGMLGFQGDRPISDPDPRRLGPEVGYWLGRPYWGQGLATEATTTALSWAARARGRRCVMGAHFADNPASGAVLVKSGFLYTGEVRRRPSLGRGGEAVDSRMMIWLA